jgi:hypothetical protein
MKATLRFLYNQIVDRPANSQFCEDIHGGLTKQSRWAVLDEAGQPLVINGGEAVVSLFFPDSALKRLVDGALVPLEKLVSSVETEQGLVPMDAMQDDGTLVQSSKFDGEDNHCRGTYHRARGYNILADAVIAPRMKDGKTVTNARGDRKFTYCDLVELVSIRARRNFVFA